MGRILIVIAAACIVGTFAVVYYSPITPVRRGSGWANTGEDASTDKGQEQKKTGSSEIRTRKRKDANPSPPVHADRGAKTADPVISRGETTRPNGSHAIVKSDSTPVYPVNSSDSRIMRLLNKGEKVATDLQVLDGEGQWSLVQSANEDRWGFVRDENLQREQPSKRSTWRPSKRSNRK